MNEELSVEGWRRRVDEKRAVAEAFVDDRKVCREAWMASGAAVEFALKARIMSKERMNRWPDRTDAPELYTHDIKALVERADIPTRELPPLVRSSFRTVIGWNRYRDYEATRMPREEARSMYQAAFGEEGVVEWLKRN